MQWAADYEPYVVVPRDCPRYDPRFVGFGWNKVAHIVQLDAQVRGILQAQGAYCVSVWHPWAALLVLPFCRTKTICPWALALALAFRGYWIHLLPISKPWQ